MKVDRYIERFLNLKDELAYVNLDIDNKYNGWVCDFGYLLPNGKRMSLNLENEIDLFLLFVLASAWSRTGPWENAAFFVGYLKYLEYNSISEYAKLDKIISSKNEIESFLNECSGIKVRRKVSFRKDIFDSIKVLYGEWSDIKRILQVSEESKDFMRFIEYMRSIEGLGSGSKKMLIKIPLILRELRCQDIYRHIPGDYCCVVDQRVKVSASNLGLKLPSAVTSIKTLLKSSKIIYENFGDLYDIPLFAYEDVIENS